MQIKKNYLLLLLCALIPFSKITAQQNYKILANGIELNLIDSKLKVEVCTDKIIHISRTPEKGTILKSLIENAQWPVTKPFVSVAKDLIVIKTKALKCVIAIKTGIITYYDTKENRILLENNATFNPAAVQGENTWNIKQSFSILPEEGLYGLGQHQDGIMNWHNNKVTLIQKNMTVAIPFLISTKNYGIFWDNYSHTEFESKEKEMSLWSEAGDCISYYFFYGADMDNVIALYRRATGCSPMLPKWAFGYWQSKERYKTEKELISVAQEYRKRSVPIDVIVQDWKYWGSYGWNAMKWDSINYPHPKEMIDSLHNIYHVRILNSIWPQCEPGAPLADELNAKGYLFKHKSWNKGMIYDAYSPEARGIYWKYVNAGLLADGLDGLWMDATEPELAWPATKLESKKEIISLGKNSLGTFSRYLNTYPFFTCVGMYENQRKVSDKKRVTVLTRSAFAGQQRTGAITWSGDIRANYDVLRKQISGGLNFSMAGNPYWTTDCGAFYPFSQEEGGGMYPLGVKDSAYCELYVRWFQFASFCPVFRSHGTDTPREIWNFGNENSVFYKTIARFDNLRYRLIPYIYSLAWQNSKNSYTIMRGLPFDFPNDPKVYNIGDSYMFGKAFLVKPVIKEMFFKADTTNKNPDIVHKIADPLSKQDYKVYLPAGTDWIDFWTGEKYQGGKNITYRVSLEEMPVFVKAGSIVPMGPFIQYTSEKPDSPLEIRIYKGNETNFTLYEDENDNYNYEKGIYSTITFHWNDKTNELTIDKRTGKFPGMLTERVFNIVIVSSAKGTGLEPSASYDKTVHYEGKQIKIKF
jgi:alpha-D-xyloside xylohydrolase